MSSDKATESNLHITLQCVYPWIDGSLFEKMLHIDYPTGDIVVKNYLLKAALGKGENYCSQMIRAKVNYTINGANYETNFIIKAAPSTEDLDEKMATEIKELFNKEIIVYNEVLSKVHDLLKAIGDKSKLHGR